MKQIPNAELISDLIPSEDEEWSTIWSFAGTFNGYEKWGEKCGPIANARLESTLTELRTCLFFEYRRWNHFGESPSGEPEQYIRGLVGKIRKYVLEGKIE